MNENMQEIADSNGFDLKKIPYGYQFRIGKLILNYYDTTGTVVISKPKHPQDIKRNVPESKIDSMLKALNGNIVPTEQLTGEQAVSLIMSGLSGVKVKHKRLGESEWRADDVRKLPLNSFLNKTFVFELEK